MNRVVDFARYVFISPEAVWVGLVFIGYFYFGEHLMILGKQLKGNTDLWKALYVLPFGFLISSFKSTNTLRSPLGKEENKALYEWPLYSKITDRAIYSLILGICSCICMFILWVYSDQLVDKLLGTLYLAFSVVPGISAFILILSVQKIKELLTKHL